MNAAVKCNGMGASRRAKQPKKRIKIMFRKLKSISVLDYVLPHPDRENARKLSAVQTVPISRHLFIHLFFQYFLHEICSSNANQYLLTAIHTFTYTECPPPVC